MLSERGKVYIFLIYLTSLVFIFIVVVVANFTIVALWVNIYKKFTSLVFKFIHLPWYLRMDKLIDQTTNQTTNQIQMII